MVHPLEECDSFAEVGIRVGGAGPTGIAHHHENGSYFRFKPVRLLTRYSKDGERAVYQMHPGTTAIYRNAEGHTVGPEDSTYVQFKSKDWKTLTSVPDNVSNATGGYAYVNPTFTWATGTAPVSREA